MSSPETLAPETLAYAIASTEIEACEAAEYAAEDMPFSYYDGCLYFDSSYMLRPEGWQPTDMSGEVYLRQVPVSMQRAALSAEVLGLGWPA